jgi:hypothetical protein
MYGNIPEGITYAVLFNETVTINHWNLIKIAILFLMPVRKVHIFIARMFISPGTYLRVLWINFKIPNTNKIIGDTHLTPPVYIRIIL